MILQFQDALILLNDAYGLTPYAATILKNAQKELRISESAYDDDNAHKFLHTVRNKTRYYQYKKYGALIALEHNQFLSPTPEQIKNGLHRMNLLS